MASQTSIDGEHVVSLQLWRYLVLLAVTFQPIYIFHIMFIWYENIKIKPRNLNASLSDYYIILR